LAFFTVYLDDSGTAPDQPIASASALIIPEKRISELESNWNRFVKVQGISDFHASACAALKSKEKQYWDLDEEQKKHIFTRARQFCKGYGVQTFGFSVYKESRASVFSEDFRYYSGDHYIWALRHILRNIEQWRKTRAIKEPMHYIFDWQEIGSDCREEIVDVMAQMAEQYNEDIHFNFGRRKDIPGLQCVDLISWLSLQLGLNNFHNKPMEGLASECIKDFENYFPNEKHVRPDHKWFQVATVQRPHLEKWFDVEMKLGKSMEWFRDWYKRHPNREVLLNARKEKRRIDSPTV
jgi:Protein of unknown function (DUF3800)